MESRREVLRQLARLLLNLTCSQSMLSSHRTLYWLFIPYRTVKCNMVEVLWCWPNCTELSSQFCFKWNGYRQQTRALFFLPHTYTLPPFSWHCSTAAPWQCAFPGYWVTWSNFVAELPLLGNIWLWFVAWLGCCQIRNVIFCPEKGSLWRVVCLVDKKDSRKLHRRVSSVRVGWIDWWGVKD